MIRHATSRWEIGLAAKFAAVGLVGYSVDATLLNLGLRAGLQPDWARVVSLVCAMQATFAINGLVVFRCLEWSRLPRQWAGYMAANGFGNFCNYWIFLTLVSTHWRIIGAPMFALTAGSACAWMINYVGTRFLVFASAAVGLRAAAAAKQRARVCAALAAAPERGPVADL